MSVEPMLLEEGPTLSPRAHVGRHHSAETRLSLLSFPLVPGRGWEGCWLTSCSY